MKSRDTPVLEIVLTLVAILVAAGLYVRSRPVQVAPLAEEQRRAVPHVSEASADVLVVLPVVADAHALDQWSTDEAWLNVVEREVGTVRTVGTSQLSRAALDPSAWAIIPRRAAAQLDPAQTQFVRNWVEDGGVLLLEQPDGPWRGITGAMAQPTRLRETRRLTAFDASEARGDLRNDLLAMPFRTTLASFVPAELARGRDYEVLLEVDGQPGAVSIPIGRGVAIVLLFDFTRLATSIMQGLPSPEFTLRPMPGEPPGAMPTTAALVADEPLRTATVPFVDLLERNLLYLLDQRRPVGRLWHFPGSWRGALLVAHTEAWSGSAVEYMTAWERRQPHSSTVFATASSMAPEPLARIARSGADIQFLWAPPEHPAAPSRTWGIGAYRPIRRPMSTLEQLDRLNRDLQPYGPVVASRTIDGAWTHDYFDGFLRLDAAGVQLDTSYGPAPAWVVGEAEHIGYMFGTGRAFRPIDRNGNRMRVRELPRVIDAAAAGYALPRVRQLIMDASERYHSAIAADWRPDVMVSRPSFDALDGWQRAFEWATSQDLWVTTFADYADFHARRDASHVESKLAREERRLTIEARIVGSAPTDEGAEQATPSIAFPARFEGRPVERLIVNNESTATTELLTTADRVLHVLPLPPGDHRVQVFYGNPVEPEPPADPGGAASPVSASAPP